MNINKKRRLEGKLKRKSGRKIKAKYKYGTRGRKRDARVGIEKISI